MNYPIEKYNIKEYTQKNKDGSESKVIVALSTYAGRVVKGVAKCIATDTFDFEKGRKLAAARCDLKVCRKRLRRASEKKHQLALKMEELSKQYDAASRYYSDALDLNIQSVANLQRVENSLK